MPSSWAGTAIRWSRCPVLDRGRDPDHGAYPEDRLDAIVTRTRNGGAEIVNFLTTGSAFYAPASSAVEWRSRSLKDRKKILPCAVFSKANTGSRGFSSACPVKLGKGGIEEMIQMKMTTR